jgi:hypothetical protein
MQRFDTINARQLDVHQNECRLSLVREAHAFSPVSASMVW